MFAVLTLSHPAQAQSVIWQAMVDQAREQATSGNYTDAEKSYVSALKSAEQFASGDERLLQTIKALASVYTQDGKLGQAKDLFQRAVNEDEHQNNGVSRSLALDLDNLAAVCYRQENYFEAEPLYKQAIEIWGKLSSGSGQATDAADDQAKLALVYERSGKYEQVESLLKTAIETYKTLAPATNKQMANALSYLSSFYRQQGKLSEAEKVCNQALELRKSAFGGDSLEVAESLTDLGKIYMTEDNPSQYESLFKKALVIRENTLGADHPQVAEGLLNLADAFQMQDKLASAMPLLQRALTINQKAYGDVHPQVAKTMVRLAVMLDKKKQYTQAENLLRKAYAIDRQVYGEDSLAIAHDATSQAMVFLNQGQYDAAEDKYKEALAITEKRFGADHPDTATCITSLAWLYKTQSKFSDALPLLQRALIIRTKSFGPTHPSVAWSLSNLGTVYDAQKDYANAEKFLQTALKVAMQSQGKDYPDVASITLELANVCEQEKKYKEAQELYKSLLERDQTVAGPSSPAVAIDFTHLARLAAAQGNIKEAADWRVRARQANGKVSDLESAAETTSRTQAQAQAQAQSGVSCPVADKWALVVGISNFKDPSINLRYAAKDATDFRNYLVNEAHFAPDHVKLLTDKAATREGIVSNLGDQWLRRLANSNDLVVVYISTHGSPATKDTNNANFMVAYETNFSNLLLTGIPMQWLTSALKDIVHCDRVVMILDVCHGGAAAPSEEKGLVREIAVDPGKLKLGEGQMLLASSEASQLSWESKSYPNGVFTRRLIEALRAHGDKTRLTDAFQNMKIKVEEEVLRDRAEVQTPIIFRKWQGEDAVLGVLPTKPRKGLADLAPDHLPNNATTTTGAKTPGGKK